MTMRTTDRIDTFHRPYCLNGVDRVLPPADYRVVTDEELIEHTTGSRPSSSCQRRGIDRVRPAPPLTAPQRSV